MLSQRCKKKDKKRAHPPANNTAANNTPTNKNSLQMARARERKRGTSRRRRRKHQRHDTRKILHSGAPAARPPECAKLMRGKGARPAARAEETLLPGGDYRGPGERHQWVRTGVLDTLSVPPSCVLPCHVTLVARSRVKIHMHIRGRVGLWAPTRPHCICSSTGASLVSLS